MSKPKSKPGKVNVLIIGSGGREHALGWKIKQSPRCGQIYFAPGNGGTSDVGTNLAMTIDQVNTKTVDEIDYFCRHNNVGLVVIGPEDTLAAGLADRLTQTADSDLAVFGPLQAAARIEADKAFAKQLMRGASIPTADAKAFTDYEAAQSYINARETPVVVKAAGLAKGKGVIVCDDQAQALEALKLCMADRAFGDAGNTVIIEERLVGQEVSILALVDGRNLYVLDPSQDHKQAGEGDTGPNTGGMGAYCPTPLISDQIMDDIQRQVLVPAIDALRREGVIFQGVLYAGLMLTAGGPKVIEFNCRFGDPELQPLLMRLKGDLLEIILATCHGRLDQVDLSWDPRCCCCVVMASGGYPGSYDQGKAITGIAQAEAAGGGDVKVFHAGTARKGDQLVTAGGRVLSVCALGSDLAEAHAKANAACDRIAFDGAWFRRDIGYRVMKQPAGAK
jgi:phosphoribosylamine--glycine ligase